MADDSTTKNNQITRREGAGKRADSQKKNSIDGPVRNRGITRNCGLRFLKRSELSPLRFFKHLRGKVVKGMHLVAMRRRKSPKVSSSGRSKPFITPVDSHRNEAIEDCIEFINSSSSLPRSNSVTT